MQKHKHKMFYATSNASKFDSVARYTKEHAPDIELTQFDREVTEIQSLDQVQIAINKAQQAWEYLGHPVLVDDTGFFINKYHQFPGTLSKFVFEGIGFEGLLKLAQPGDAAYFRVSLVYYNGPQQYEVFEAFCHGRIVMPDTFHVPKGYPYIFFFAPDGSDQSYAQLHAAGNDTPYNARITAFQQFLRWYLLQHVHE